MRDTARLADEGATDTAARHYGELRAGVALRLVGRDFVAVSGPDALVWLQGQLSQDVEALGMGASAESLLLTPQGKIDAYMRVTRAGEDRVLLDVQDGWGDAVWERLIRFKLRVKADMERLEWRCLSLRGPASAEAATQAAQEPETLVLSAGWPGLPGVDVVGPSVSVPAGREPCDLQAWESARIEAGVPAMGSELDERTIPVEAGLVPRAASLTKGCYTGQELVARLDARGNRVPRLLRGVLLEGAAPVGATLQAVRGQEAAGERMASSPSSGDSEGSKAPKSIGTLTSVALSPGLGPVALAYVRREIVPPASVEAAWPGGRAGGRVEELPLAS